jgi:hypothetical protein
MEHADFHAGQVHATPSATSMTHAQPGMEHSNFHVANSCGNAGVDGCHEQAAYQRVNWLNTAECRKIATSYNTKLGCVIFFRDDQIFAQSLGLLSDRQ